VTTNAAEVEEAFVVTAASIRRPRRGIRMARAVVPPIVGVGGFLLLWQLLVTVLDIPQFELPAPSAILRHIASDPAFYITNARVTLWEAFLGFWLGLIGALAVAAIMAHSRFVEQAVTPLAVLVQVTPLIAYAPALVIWLGFGMKPILVGTALVCFVPFLFNAVVGFRSIDPTTHELLRSVDASKREVFFRLRVPHALPYLFSAARIAVGLALIGAVLTEFFAGVRSGLGWSVKQAQAFNLALQLWGSIFVLAFLGAAATALIGLLERVVLRWHSSQDAVSP
jgi:NitT/TauT family transport system permease protein